MGQICQKKKLKKITLSRCRIWIYWQPYLCNIWKKKSRFLACYVCMYVSDKFRINNGAEQKWSNHTIMWMECRTRSMALTMCKIVDRRTVVVLVWLHLLASPTLYISKFARFKWQRGEFYRSSVTDHLDIPAIPGCCFSMRPNFSIIPKIQLVHNIAGLCMCLCLHMCVFDWFCNLFTFQM
jgi:hypothetical protein